MNLVSKIKQIRQILNKSPDDVKILYLEIQELKSILLSWMLAQTVNESPRPPVTQKEEPTKALKQEALDELKHMATNKVQDGQIVYCLHRAAPDYEYEKFADEYNYETTKNTEWLVDVESAQGAQKDANPVVSCYIPESAIVDLPNPHGNTSTWGTMGSNPNAYKYKIVIKPGKYRIFQELKT